MGLLEAEIFELRKLRKEFRQGSRSREDVNTEIGIFSQTEKRAKLLLQAHVVGKKIGGLSKQIYASNLIGDGQAIDTDEGSIEEQKVCCPIKEKTISRAECLDYSGSHYDDCKGCDVGKKTKETLLPQD